MGDDIGCSHYLVIKMKLVLTLVSFVSFSGAKQVHYNHIKDVRPDYVITIEPDYDTDYGDWNGGAFCDDNEYAHGFKQKTDAWCSGGGECTGLNAIGKLWHLILK